MPPPPPSDAPTLPALDGLRVLVVGASEGLGRAVVVASVAAGAAVAGVARRGCDVPGAVSIRADVTATDEPEWLVREAFHRLGGVDAIVATVGVNHLAYLRDTTEADWAALVGTNLVGPSLVAASAVQRWTEAATGAPEGRRGRVLLCSSDSVAYPFPGLGAYAASKAALDTLVGAWRTEEPFVDWVRVVVGPTLTDMVRDWDADLAATLFARWADEGYLGRLEPQTPEAAARCFVELLAAAEPPHDVCVFEGELRPLD